MCYNYLILYRFMHYIDNTIIQHTSVIKLHTQNAVKNVYVTRSRY